MSESLHFSFPVLKDVALATLKSYAAILFLSNPIIGIIILLASFTHPNVGICGLVSCLSAILFARFLNFSKYKYGLLSYNSLWFGLATGFKYTVNLEVLLIISIGSIFTLLLWSSLTQIFWNISKLPALSLPFIIVTYLVHFALPFQSNLEVSQLSYPSSYLFPYEMINLFFSSIGSIFFLPIPLVGAFLFISLFLTSRLLGLLSILGFIFGYATINFFYDGYYAQEIIKTSGFNFILTAIAIGGIFTLPSFHSIILAGLSSIVCAVFTVAGTKFLTGLNLQALTLPTLFTLYPVILGLKGRSLPSKPQLNLNNSFLPEENLERLKLRLRRGYIPDSLPLRLPYYGEWSVYQGFFGPYTHKAPFEYSIDFYVERNGRSFKGDGQKISDYYCFGLPVASPCYGQVINVVNHIYDNPPGAVNTYNNFGNYILIKHYLGYYVVLAHFQCNSITVSAGAMVHAGQLIGKCGNSGRSIQPHLHIQAQIDANLGCQTLPFYFINTIQKSGDQSKGQLKLGLVPTQNDKLLPINENRHFLAGLSLTTGRSFYYEVKVDDKPLKRVQLVVRLSFAGDFILQSESSASVSFCEFNGVLTFYDRQGPKDKFLDLWLLALGITPLSTELFEWEDYLPIKIMPLERSKRLFYQFLYPFGSHMTNRYHRRWSEKSGTFVQCGEHFFEDKFGLKYSYSTTANLSDYYGITHINLQGEGRFIEANLVASGYEGGVGVSGWLETNQSSHNNKTSN